METEGLNQEGSNYRHFRARYERLRASLLYKFRIENKSAMLWMSYIVVILGLLLVTMMLWDAFEVIILPRRITRRLRFARLFYRLTWRLRSVFAQCVPYDKKREDYLSFFGPLSLLLLLCAWATGLIAGFAMLQWGLQDRMNVAQGAVSFSTYLYLRENRTIQEPNAKRFAEG